MMTSLMDMGDHLGVIFPPDWKIKNLYYGIFRDTIWKWIERYVSHMDVHVENDHGLLLSCL